MNIGISDVTPALRSHSGGSGLSISHGHAQQLLAAALGYKALASYQAARKTAQEPGNFDQIRHIVIDRACLTDRSVELGVGCDIDQLSSFLTSAFADRVDGLVLHRSTAISKITSATKSRNW